MIHLFEFIFHFSVVLICPSLSFCDFSEPDNILGGILKGLKFWIVTHFSKYYAIHYLISEF